MSEMRTLAVVGAGNMGSGIAQKMATEGFRVLLVDLAEAQLDRGLAGIKKTLEEGVARKIFKPDQAEAILGRIVKTTDWAKLSEAELVVEAVFEDLDVKKQVFKRLGENTKPSCVLGTNTSSFYVRDLLPVVAHPERVVGLHYFYHPAKNRLVEVIPTEKTSKDALAKAVAVQAAMSKTAITCADAPGFVVNRYFVPWLNEAVRLLDEGVANLATIEAAGKETFGVGMGPFELMNVTGVPIALHAASTLGRELGALYAPSPRLKAQVESKQNWPLDGEVDASKKAAVADRLLGATFLIAAALVDEKVGSIEDTDIGARVGLRWPKGPFELMNRLGVAKAAELAAKAGAPYGVAVPKILAGRSAPFTFKLVETTIEGGVATLTINRPDALNALNEEVMKQLDAAFDAAAARADVATIVIAGKGKAFIAGADIRYFVKRIESKKIDEIVAFTRRGHETLLKFAAARQVVIALVDGLSLGGGSELALACDYVVATPKASFGFPETGIGIYPGLGGTQRLTRRVGVALSKAFIYTGNGIGADVAAKIGVVDKLVSHEGVAAAIKELSAKGKPKERKAPAAVPAGFEKVAAPFAKRTVAEILGGAEGSDADEKKTLDRVRQKAPVALRIAERLIEGAATWPIQDGVEAELSHLSEIFATSDAYLGLSTLGKSRPTFTGK
jgi:enoyl-CoA hydratase / 3-hydroxyacyl-CoA dehydrogenase